MIIKFFFKIIFSAFFSFNNLLSQNFVNENSIGLILNTDFSYDAYTLLAPLGGKKIYLINNFGEKVHEWSSEYRPGAVNYLLEDGSILRACSVDSEYFNAGGKGGRIEIISWENEIKWHYELSSNENRLHHDLEILPNGNILAMLWNYIDPQTAIDNGKNPITLEDSTGVYKGLWSEKIIEIDTSDNSIVWEWNAFDHIIQDFDSTKRNYGILAENPQLIDINSGQSPGDWLHFNSIDYNKSLDQIILTSLFNSEIYIIDHSTNTDESSSNIGGNYNIGGDLLYRWGNPLIYDQGDSSSQKLFFPHDAHWLEHNSENNKIMIFNNGFRRNYSSVEIIETPINSLGKYDLNSDSFFGPLLQNWIYKANPDTSFYSPFVSGAQRLKNGNTLICDGPHGNIFEIDSQKNIVWKYINPIAGNNILTQGDTIPISDSGTPRNFLFRAYKYDYDYGVLSEKSLVPYGLIEKYLTYVKSNSSLPDEFKLHSNFPNPFNPSTSISYSLSEQVFVSLDVYDVLGKKVKSLVSEIKSTGNHSILWDGTNDQGELMSGGVYIYSINAGNFHASKKMIFIK